MSIILDEKAKIDEVQGCNRLVDMRYPQPLRLATPQSTNSSIGRIKGKDDSKEVERKKRSI